jgi:hypothetical protein
MRPKVPAVFADNRAWRVPMSSISSVTSVAAAASQLMAETSFSTTVNGKSYSGSVSYSDGEYVASDPDLAGASATGSSEIAAENNLATRIDELV